MSYSRTMDEVSACRGCSIGAFLGVVQCCLQRGGGSGEFLRLQGLGSLHAIPLHLELGSLEQLACLPSALPTASLHVPAVAREGRAGPRGSGLIWLLPGPSLLRELRRKPAWVWPVRLLPGSPLSSRSSLSAVFCTFHGTRRLNKTRLLRFPSNLLALMSSPWRSMATLLPVS